MTHWTATVDLTAGSVLLQLHNPQGDLRLKAHLPDPPRHPRALMTLLEGLALWSGQTLYAAISVDGSAAPSLDSPDGGLPWPEDSPLVQFHFLLRRRARPGGVRGADELRRLGLLR